MGWGSRGTGEVQKWLDAAVVVRPSQTTGVVNLGITVPDLDSAPTNVFDRWTSDVRSTGLGLVPVADLRLIAYSSTQVLFDGHRYIGVTNTPVALLVAVVTLAIAVLCLHGFAAAPGSMPAGLSPLQKLAHLLRLLLSFDWVLTLIRTPDGRASLSAFQILLWTIVVAVSAMYVMALSGNLINLTPGTLTLLGIAGAAGLIAAFGDSRDKAQQTQGNPQDQGQPEDAQRPAVPDRKQSGPVWRDLVIDPKTGQPDIGRTQMLLFTVVSAVFVIVQVLTYYVVPDIPAGYQILMGISNGVYVGRKFTS